MATKVLGWPKHILDELARNQNNGRVGGRLVSETERVRVWFIALNPGQRLGFHKHVLNYFWTVVRAGRGRSQYADGQVFETEYQTGDTKHLQFAPGEFMIHDLGNTGDTVLEFTTVEFKDSPNDPLPLTP
jgi:quercetin dioxygenase-like cupin family protein